MYTITEENLKLAYRKLKSYVYHSSGQTYLKKKVYDFERKLSSEETTFKQLSASLNGLAEKQSYYLIGSLKIGELVYPKKDQLQYTDDNQIIVNDYNIFIDMPIELFLVDVLFTFILFDKFKELNLNDKDVYGSVFDERLYETERPLKNNLIFRDYQTAYEDWKNSALNVLETSSEKNRYLVKMDLKRCFYNIKFSFDRLLSNYGIDENNPIVRIMRGVYWQYSDRINWESGMTHSKGDSILPIGLISSYPILNMLLQGLDRRIKELPKVMSYSRFIDDILIIIDGDDIKRRNNIALSDLLDGIVKDQTLTVYSELIVENILLNTDKQYIKFYQQGISDSVLRNNYKGVFNASLADRVNEKDDYDEPVVDDIGLSMSVVRKQIDGFNAGRIDDVKEVIRLIQSLSDLELINCYRLWNDIFEFVLRNTNNAEYQKLLKRIRSIISRCEASSQIFEYNDKLSDYLQRALKIEISTINSLIKKDAQSTFFLNNIRQKDIIDHIENVREKREIKYFFPVDVSIEEIQFYLSYNNAEWENFLQEADGLFSEINGYKLNKEHPFYSLSIDIESSNKSTKDKEQLTKRQLVYIKKKDRNKDSDASVNKDGNNTKDPDASVNVAVAGLNMHGVEVSDFQKTYPAHYSFKDIVRMVDESARNDAKYILFPEFTLLINDVFDLIKLCKKLEISIVIGLAHVFNNNSFATNYTLIYDNLMGIAILREKNYLPPEEKLLIAENKHTYQLKSIPEYVILHNELMTYSSMTCYETTCIVDRALLTNKIEVLFMPVYNRDTNYFSNIVYSFSRDASCFIAQSNNNQYGDSRITAPTKQLFSDIVKIKGGENNYAVIGKIELGKLRDSIDKFDETLKQLDIGVPFLPKYVEKIKQKYKDIKEKNFKPLSAGINMAERKKNLGK